MAELAIMAATGLGASAGTAATIGTIASIGLTAASAFSSIQAGKQQSESLKIQARQAGVNARAERLQGKQQALAIQDQLDRDLASQNALFSARGILQGEGSAEAARTTASNNATRDIDVARFNAEMGALDAEQRGANARADASAAKQQGIFDAVGTLSSFKSVKAPTGGVSKVPIPKRKPSLVG